MPGDAAVAVHPLKHHSYPGRGWGWICCFRYVLAETVQLGVMALLQKVQRSWAFLQQWWFLGLGEACYYLLLEMDWELMHEYAHQGWEGYHALADYCWQQCRLQALRAWVRLQCRQ